MAVSILRTADNKQGRRELRCREMQGMSDAANVPDFGISFSRIFFFKNIPRASIQTDWDW